MRNLLIRPALLVIEDKGAGTGAEPVERGCAGFDDRLDQRFLLRPNGLALAVVDFLLLFRR